MVATPSIVEHVGRKHLPEAFALDLPLSGTLAIPVGDHVSLIDEADRELVEAYTWRPEYNRAADRVYAYTTIRRRAVRLHRLILAPPKGIETDHINGNGLDNRRANLRPATTAENSRNIDKPRFRDGRPASSKYKGVYFHRLARKWGAQIGVNYRRLHLGLYVSEVDAARAYNRAALHYFGEFARLNNVPEGDHE